jgi:hypothetical protein
MSGGWALAAVALTALGSPEGDAWARLVERLYTRTIQSQLHRSILSRHGVREEDAGGWAASRGEPVFTQKKFPVTIGRAEEWPPFLRDSLWLLKEPAYPELIALCGEARRQPLEGKTAIERLTLQTDLWAAFDSVLRHGVRPMDRGDLDYSRWQTLLSELAQVMRHVALTDAELDALPSGEALRREVFRKLGAGEGKPVEFFTVETPSIHDFAHEFRRVNRFFYWDPKLDFGALSAKQALALRDRDLSLSPGAVAVLEEDAIGLTRNGELVGTTVPLFFKAYRVREDGETLEFSMYRVRAGSLGLEPDALLPLPADTEAWAHVDLPNIPGREVPAYRAPMSGVCRGCHAADPNAFHPSYDELQPAHFRFTREHDRFGARRILGAKVSSAEFKALREYFNLTPPRPRPDATPSALARNAEWIVGGAALLVTMAVLTLRSRRRPRLAAPEEGRG